MDTAHNCRAIVGLSPGDHVTFSFATVAVRRGLTPAGARESVSCRRVSARCCAGLAAYQSTKPWRSRSRSARASGRLGNRANGPDGVSMPLSGRVNELSGLVEIPAFDHATHSDNIPNIGQGSAIENDEVRQLPPFQHSNIHVATQRPRRINCRRTKRFGRRESSRVVRAPSDSIPVMWLSTIADSRPVLWP